MLWCVVIVLRSFKLTDTACHSVMALRRSHLRLASQHLQELEGLVGSERQKQEETIKKTMGSMYAGEALYSWVGYMALTSPLYSRFRHRAYF
jgi:hypothetical protein